MRLGGQPPTLPIPDQASHPVCLPDSPPDGGDAAMAVVSPAATDERLATVMPARAKARTFLQRSDPSPEPSEPLGPVWANRGGEVAMLRQ